MVGFLPMNRQNPVMVGLGGLEPPASPLSGVRSNHLSYRPGNLCINKKTSPTTLPSKRGFIEESDQGWSVLLVAAWMPREANFA